MDDCLFIEYLYLKIQSIRASYFRDIQIFFVCMKNLIANQ